MKTNIICIRLGGIMNLLAAVLHGSFWQAFDWSQELIKLNTMNSNIVQMLNLFTIVFFIYVGLLLLSRPQKVISQSMGKHFLGMLTAMWTARFFMEFYFPKGDIIFAVILFFTIICLVYPLLSSVKVRYQMSNTEHLKHPWYAHGLLQDFEIEDVWKLPVEMTKNQPVSELQTAFSNAIEEISHTGIVGWLFQFRFFMGRVFGWEDERKTIETLPKGSIRRRYAEQNGLSEQNFSMMTSPHFASVYQKHNESLSEIENKTIHAAVHYGKVCEPNVSASHYRVQMTVYVKPKGMFGKAYMFLIKPFRLFLVYPVMLRVIQKYWLKQHQSPVQQSPVLT